MKGKNPMMVIAIGVGKKKEDDEMEDMMEENNEMEDEEEMGKGGMMKYSAGGSLKMVNKGGEKVPFFAADGKGKMKAGGYTYAKGGMTGKNGRDGVAIRGKTKGRMV